MEIGSFIALDLSNTGEYYHEGDDIARLNSARAGICYSCRLYACESIYIPYYLCPTVRRFLLSQGIKVEYYYINDSFEPSDFHQDDDHAILLVNYFGIIPSSRIEKLARQYKNVIIDNSAAFYSPPVSGCFNVYSPRKFFGVPDGCYVIGENANRLTSELDQDISSLTSSFLFKRIEFSLKETYKERMENEQRIDHSGVLKMSVLTRLLLCNIDYPGIKNKRKENFSIAHELFGKMNRIDPAKHFADECVPMVYPFVFDGLEFNGLDLDQELKDHSVFLGRWWKSVLSDVDDVKFEAWLSKFMSPIPVDQRYGLKELKYIQDLILIHFNS